MPAGVRVLEASLLRRFPADDIVAVYPADLAAFIGPKTRVVAVSTHNPLGVTFAAGVYTSIFGSSKQPINAHYARQLFADIKANPYRASFRVIVGGSGGWQITQTDSWEELGVDCVVEGRSESADTLALFDRALRGEPLPRQVDVAHPKSREAILFPDKRTTFGVVEMTTGCGRRCRGYLGAALDQCGGPSTAAVPDMHLVAAVEQPPGDTGAHCAEADESNFHGSVMRYHLIFPSSLPLESEPSTCLRATVRPSAWHPS